MKLINTVFLLAALSGVLSKTAMAAPDIFIPLGDANQIQVLDTATNQITGTINEVSNAHGLAITPDNLFLIAGSLNESKSDKPILPEKPKAISEEEHKKHHAKQDGNVANDVGTSFVSVISIANKEVARKIPVRGAVHHVAVSPDSNYAITTHPGTGSVSVIDLKKYQVVENIKTGASPNYVVFSDNGEFAYVSNAGDNSASQISVHDWSIKQNYSTGRAPEHIVLSSDGATLYTNNVGDGTVSSISTSDQSPSRVYPVGASPHGLDLSDDEVTLFSISKAENKLVAINLNTGVTRKIALSPSPYHLMALRGNASLYVTSRAENKLWVIDQISLNVIFDISLNGIGHQMVATY